MPFFVSSSFFILASHMKMMMMTFETLLISLVMILMKNIMVMIRNIMMKNIITMAFEGKLVPVSSVLQVPRNALGQVSS